MEHEMNIVYQRYSWSKRDIISIHYSLKERGFDSLLDDPLRGFLVTRSENLWGNFLPYEGQLVAERMPGEGKGKGIYKDDGSIDVNALTRMDKALIGIMRREYKRRFPRYALAGFCAGAAVPLILDLYLLLSGKI